MPDNYEVIYAHPGGAVATFVRQDGELDSLAKGLDSEQFWVFKSVKSLLARNDEGDLGESNRLMASIGFTHRVRVITAPEQVAPAIAREPIYAAAETHAHGVHLPGPSYWPVALAISIMVAFTGFLVWGADGTFMIAWTGIGMLGVLISMIGWGLEPI
ncbi:MAG: hypothetical protein ABI068_14870 [Ktedonobacterales bacterium]